MTAEDFRTSLVADAPPEDMPATLAALWWDAKDDWTRAHGLVDELETPEAMAVHAYLHRKEGSEANAEYWYQRAGTHYRRPQLQQEWKALLEGLTQS